MKLHLKTMLVGSMVFGLAGYVAYAENVTVSTFYPSPYGSYQDLQVTQTLTAVTGNITTLNVAGNSVLTGTLGVTGTTQHTGRVGIGQAPPAVDILGVTGNTTFTGSVSAASAAVTGNLSLNLRDGAGQAGNLQVDCDGAGCYAVYA